MACCIVFYALLLKIMTLSFLLLLLLIYIFSDMHHCFV